MPVTVGSTSLREEVLVWPFRQLLLQLRFFSPAAADELLPGLKVCWPPKLSQSTVHGVVYRCHCIPVSIYQLLCNILGKM